VQECTAELLNGDNFLIESTRNEVRATYERIYSLRSGSEQRKLVFYFEMYRKTLTKEAKLRLVCKDVITPWSPISSIPQQEFYKLRP
jgi:hypothetical protein